MLLPAAYGGGGGRFLSLTTLLTHWVRSTYQVLFFPLSLPLDCYLLPSRLIVVDLLFLISQALYLSSSLTLSCFFSPSRNLFSFFSLSRTRTDIDVPFTETNGVFPTYSGDN